MKRRIIFGLLGVLVLIGGVVWVMVRRPAGICPITPPLTTTGTWSTLPDMPTARSEIAATVVDRHVYVAGGLVATGATNVVERYDVDSQMWEEVAPLPERIHHFGMATVAGKVYVTGGYVGLNLSEPLAESWVYDPAGDVWTPIAPLPEVRAAHAMVAYDDKLYVVGGVGTFSTFVFMYDPAGDNWSTANAPIPTPREHLAAAVLDDQIYAIGGRWQGNLPALESYSPTADQWTVHPGMPTARGGLTVATLTGQIHVAGGEDFNRELTCTFAQHEVYDPITQSWTALVPLPTARHGLTSVTIDGQWLVIGGGTKAAAETLLSATSLIEVFSNP